MEKIDHIIVGLWEAASRDCDTQCPELTSGHTSTVKTLRRTNLLTRLLSDLTERDCNWNFKGRGREKRPVFVVFYYEGVKVPFVNFNCHVPTQFKRKCNFQQPNVYIHIWNSLFQKNILWQPLWTFSEKFGFLKPRCRREEQEEEEVSCCINWRFDGFTAAASPILLLTPLQLQLLSNFSSAHCGYYSYKYEEMHKEKVQKRERNN